MGETDDGSSNAAHGAQDRNVTGQKGLFGRLLDALNPTELDDTEADEQGPQPNGAPPAPLPVGMLNLRRMRVDDVVIPRADIVAVPLDIKKEDLVNVFRESGMTRLPVYNSTLDTPVGLVHLKDFALTHGFNGTGERFSLRKMVRPVLYAPPSMPIGVLLQKMQTERMHMALVIDEYGGVDGLVTIEDLIEQVIGEIEDEHDIDEAKAWSEEKPGCFIAQAKAPLDEFEQEIGMKLVDAEDEEEIDTLGGLVFMLSGRIPARGEVIRHEAGVDFEVIDADPRRIKRLRVRLPKTANA